MIQGDPGAIEARLRELVALGITYFVVSGGSPGPGRELAAYLG